MNARRRLLARVECLEDRVTPAAGVLDPTFNTTGTVTTDFGFDDRAHAVAVQPDGKIVVAGADDGGSADFAVARYNADGTLDTTFNTTGKQTVTFGAVEFATAVALQADGKIVVAGYTSAAGNNDFAVVRLNADGTLDTTFNTTGKQTVAFNNGAGNDDEATGVAVQPDGKIVLGGFSQFGTTDYDFAAARLNTDGSLDTTFSGDGKQTLAFDLGNGNTDKANALALQPDGKIVLAGSATTAGTQDFAVGRLNADGTVDTTFNTTGKQTIDFGNTDTANAVAVRPDGRILLAGSWDGGNSDFALAQFTPTGAVDNTFGGGYFAAGSGKFNLTFGTSGTFGQQEFATGVAVQPDGKVVVSGYTDGDVNAGPNNFAVARVLANGSGLDTTFGTAGKTQVDFGGDDKAYGLALQPDGAVVVAGTTLTAGSGNFAVARLQGNTADVGVTVTSGAPRVVAGGTATFTVTVTNAGPDPATGAAVALTLPATLTGVTFTSTAAGGATGNTATGTGSPADTLGLPSGSSVIYTVTGTVSATAVVSLAVAAAVTPPATGSTDPTTANDTATVTVPVLPAPHPILVGGRPDGTATPYAPLSGAYTAGAATTFFPGSTANVRVATADVNGDGVADYIVGTGPGVVTQVKVVDGKTGATIVTWQPFEASFTGGVFVAAADMDGDGKAEVVVSPDQGGGPVAAVYSGALLAAGTGGDAAQIVRFFGIDDPAFRGGARTALGDVSGDGKADLIVSAGFLGGPRITIWDGASILSKTPSQRANFFAFEDTLRNGAFVAAGDLNGDGIADIAFGAGPGGAPRVRVFDGATLTAEFAVIDFPPTSLDGLPSQVANFFAGDSSLRGGVRLSLQDVDGNGTADLTTGSGEGDESTVRVYKSANLLAHASPAADQTIDPFGTTLTNGVFVG